MKPIIIPTDFSAAAANAVNYGIALAKDMKLPVILFHSFQVPLTATEASVMMTEASIERMKLDAEAKLQMSREAAEKESGIPAVYTQIRIGNTVNELGEFCSEVRPFAVVMGSTGHSALGRALFGSTTLAAMRHLNWPIIAVPPGTGFKTIRKIGLASDLKQVAGSLPSSFIREIANAWQAELHILYVNHQNPRYDPVKNEELSRIQQSLPDMKLSYHFVEHVDIDAGINQYARENNLDLVITIPKRHNLFDSIFHKSGSKQILFGSEIPVMAIHEP